MNTIEKALMHALFFHLHHNIDKAIDFKAIESLNDQVGKIFPNALEVGPGDNAAVGESARYGAFGAAVDLSKVSLKVDDITPEEIMFCETQGRMAVQVEEKDVDEVLTSIRSKGAKAETIGEINDEDKQVFEYQGKTIAVIPNRPSEADLEELTKEG